MAGPPQQRAGDIHTLFTDPEVAGLLAITGGSGANRVLPLLDYGLIQRHPKFLGGFSDRTTLITAVHVQTGLVTFHAPLARSDRNPYSRQNFEAVAMCAAQDGLHTLRNPESEPGSNALDGRTTALRSGRALSRLLGGTLAVL